MVAKADRGARELIAGEGPGFQPLGEPGGGLLEEALDPHLLVDGQYLQSVRDRHPVILPVSPEIF